MKLDQMSCPACLRVTSKNTLTCDQCGFTRQPTQAEVWEQRWRVMTERVATIGRTYAVGTYPVGDDGPSKLIH